MPTASKGFTRLPAWATGLRGISPCARLILYTLISYDWAKNGKRKGYVYPSQSRLADELGMSRKTVGKYIDELEAVGLISRDGYARNGVWKLRINYGACVKATQPALDGCVNLTQPGEYDLPNRVSKPYAQNKTKNQRTETPLVATIVASRGEPQGSSIEVVPNLVSKTSARPATGSLLLDPVVVVDDEPSGAIATGHDREPAPLALPCVNATRFPILDRLAVARILEACEHLGYTDDGEPIGYTDKAWDAMITEYGAQTISDAAKILRCQYARGVEMTNPAGLLRGICKRGPRFTAADVEAWNMLRHMYETGAADTEDDIEQYVARCREDDSYLLNVPARLLERVLDRIISPEAKAQLNKIADEFLDELYPGVPA